VSGVATGCSPSVISTLLAHYRLPTELVDIRSLSPNGNSAGFFRFGDEVLFGKPIGISQETIAVALDDVFPSVEVKDGTCYLPFDLDEAITNLREEVYASGSGAGAATSSFAKNVYYTVRPLLGVAVRKHLQRFALRRAHEQQFPSWPVDRTVEKTFAGVLNLAMKAAGVDRLPFIWFWPEGQSGCVLMTHDVETGKGLAFCSKLMDLNDSQRIKSAFQIVPAERYVTPQETLDEIKAREFEVNVHDWNHDGRLYSDRQLFIDRAKKINDAGVRFGAKGFRSGALYRNPKWYDSLNFEYDMSIPNVAHLDPQPGGCCTIMPYFIGDILEIPVTTIQDYSLFHIRREYSIDLWKRQIDVILESSGLASFIVHPDYIIDSKARDVYVQLLAYLASLRASRKVWITRPHDVNRWWRQRSQMELVRSGATWQVKGNGSERARVGYVVATEHGVEYTLA
jgi:hypothetical protein